MRKSLLIILLALGFSACTQDMATQPRYNPLRASDFFGDRRSARPPIPGTVARGYLRADEKRYTGMSNGEEIDTPPFPMTKAELLRGQERYKIYCTPCHDQTGYGNGVVAQRGFRHPPSFHLDRLRNAPLGHFFDAQTRGFGAMIDLADRIPPDDRWRIAAYIRVLQYSQQAKASDVPAGIIPEEMPMPGAMPAAVPASEHEHGAAPAQPAPATPHMQEEKK